MLFKSPISIHLSNHILDCLPLIFHKMQWSTKSLSCNIFFHTWDPEPVFHSILLECCFLQYLLWINILHIELLVQNFHHNLQNKAINTSCTLLNPNPPFSSRKHKELHLIQCLFSPPILFLQKNLSKILLIELKTLEKGFTTDRQWMGILC